MENDLRVDATNSKHDRFFFFYNFKQFFQILGKQIENRCNNELTDEVWYGTPKNKYKLLIFFWLFVISFYFDP